MNTYKITSLLQLPSEGKLYEITAKGITYSILISLLLWTLFFIGVL